MNVSSCSSNVAPPNTVTIARLAQSMGPTLRCLHQTHPIWAKVDAMATAVATKIPASLKARKKRKTGNRSKMNFIVQNYTDSLLLQLDGCRIDAIAQPGRLRPILED